MGPNNTTNGATTTLMFGPQTLSLQNQWLNRLRSSLRSHEDNAWMLRVLRELPALLERFANRGGSIIPTPDASLARSIAEWMISDASEPLLTKLPTAILTPLIILTQLAQYSQYMRTSKADSGIDTDPWSALRGSVKVLGFCTGFLSELAIACAASKLHFETYGAVVVRLGALLGAVVNAGDSASSDSVSLSAAWTTPEQAESLQSIIAADPETYISVHYDESRATVTTSVARSSEVRDLLKQKGLLATQIGLRGRFHWEGHREAFQELIAFCDDSAELQLPDAAQLLLPIYSTSTGEPVKAGKLHHLALRDILVEPCNWYETFKRSESTSLQDETWSFVIFGDEKCVPPSISRDINERVIFLLDREVTKERLAAGNTQNDSYDDDDIAVVGMACKVAGADDLDELWDLMVRGESQHIEVPESRFTFETQWRDTDPSRKWFGNFLNDHDAYDHRFFKKSPRESASQDPQQRLFLQSAYQAVEQSGYFNSPNPDPRVGVFVGVCAADYEANVACYQPNAFTATGNLKSFIAGKISHYFGWTGPGLVIDTACSASAVAIHQACRAILHGECTAAIAGGVTIMTSPLWFQNLAGATFLSQTGACKPFDADADGYCRGEAIASVFLKKMSEAVKDGNTILGRIRSTAVSQNDNCTPIFVPNAPSLSSLFGNVLEKAHMRPEDITLVEAHGTGTPVGDPAEYESIKRILGGRSRRASPLHLGSIKGLVGHTESASGVVALIKVLLLLYHGFVPPQASFKRLSPGVKATADDMIEINTRLEPWKSEYRAALINNYGASGSNASMVISQAYSTRKTSPPVITPGELFWLTALDERGLREYCIRLRALITSRKSPSEIELSLANISYSLARQSNRGLNVHTMFQCSSIQALDSQLSDLIEGRNPSAIVAKQTQRPVILCFGGQISQSIGLDKVVIDRYGLLRHHLNRCDTILLSLGYESIYPTIFEKTPILDTVKLQTTLFAFQYSCAMSWIDCGIPVAAVVGHSFGELTAMCVAGVLSLKDSLRVIAARAGLVKSSWGSDSGSMIAIEAELDAANDIIRRASAMSPNEKPATIACFNGPRSFTLAGSTAAIKEVETIAHGMPGIRSKVLSVANAYHSTLVEPLQDDLAKLADGLLFTEPIYHWERATESTTDPRPLSTFFAQHMREPVYANHAFQRLNEKYPSAVWLEAGSNSTITNMAGRALSQPKESHFQAVNICSPSAVQNLLDMFLNLWKQGLTAHHWGHHASQAQLYDVVILPPYQFEKTRHWMELKKPEKVQPLIQQAPQPVLQLPVGLFTFVGYQDGEGSQAKFRINTMVEQYKELVAGHLIAETAPICPATVQIDIVIEAFFSIRPDVVPAKMQPEIHNVVNMIPVCVDDSRAVWLDLTPTAGGSGSAWDWKITSTNAAGAHAMEHVKGQLVVRALGDPKLISEFSRFERMMSHRRCLDLLNDDQPDDVIQGRNMYKVFAEIVDYAEPYHGLQKLIGKGHESAGRVVKKRSGKTWLDAHLSDSFSQVGGFWVNCMTDRLPADMYIAAGFESWMRAPGSTESSSKTSVWDVMALHHRVSDKSYTTDIFIYDSQEGLLREVILGVNYARIPKATMIKTLKRLSPGHSAETSIAPSQGAQILPPKTTMSSVPPQITQSAAPAVSKMEAEAPQQVAPPAAASPSKKKGNNILPTVAEILVELTGLEPELMKIGAKLADIGIDSLMGMEMAHELETAFKCTLDMDTLADATTISDVVKAVATATGVSIDGDGPDDMEVGDDSDDSASTSVTKTLTPSSSLTSLSENGSDRGSTQLILPGGAVLDAFGQSKLLTDRFIEDFNCNGYMDTINPKQTQLCIALILEAFEELGCSIKSAKSGQVLPRIPFAPQHARLVQYLYEVLEADGRLVNLDDGLITRTAIAAPSKSSKDIVDGLIAAYPDHNFANRLTHYCGGYLVEVLKGNMDGVKVIFGTPQGKEMVSGLYGESLLNKLFYTQMQDILTRLSALIPRNQGPLKILEMGAGTGGTTKYLVPLLAELGIPVEYTFTDLSPSFVAQARKTYKAYPFMKFAAHDIEKPAPHDLIGTQHLIVASNAVHATHSLPISLKHIHQFLRPDGFLMMLEMTSQVRWVDMIFGLLEGWWLFDDSRPHALSHQTHWEKELHGAGYGHVDWTDGHHPENTIQRIIIAMASGPKQSRLPLCAKPEIAPLSSNLVGRESAVAAYVERYTCELPKAAISPPSQMDEPRVILVTGATGSLGSHLVAHLAGLPEVTKVVCLNRPNRGTKAEERQLLAFDDRNITLSADAKSKLTVLQVDSAKPCLGMEHADYLALVASITHIVHNAWPMSGNRPVERFEPQFQAMHNLLNLSLQASSTRSVPITFQLISSIAVVGHQPLLTGRPNVPEEPVQIDSVLPNGYGDAKFVCERMLATTLGQHPQQFRTMSVRLGQVSGSSKTGYWNAQEHLSFLVKSSQTLRCLPDFGKTPLSWTPVDIVAGTCADLILQTEATPYPIYHIDNPIRQPWDVMLRIWAEELDVPIQNIIGFEEWVERVRRFPGSVEKDNPAFKLVDFLDGNFLRMSCGGLLLDTEKTREHSVTLREAGPVADQVARGYINYWKRSGFLHA